MLKRFDIPADLPEYKIDVHAAPEVKTEVKTEIKEESGEEKKPEDGAADGKKTYQPGFF